jgi:serine protease
MKTRNLLVASTLSVFACAEAIPLPAESTESTELSMRAHRPDSEQVIISFMPGRAGAGRAAVDAQGGRVVTEIRGLNAVAAKLPPQALDALARNPNVEYIEPDSPRYLLSTGGAEETVPYGITMVQADRVQPGPHQRTVCIIDSGYSMQHEDLQTANVTASPDPGTGDAFFDDNGHGTHVAGTIAALGDNGKGVVGVVRDGSLRLHIVKVFTKDGWAYSSSLANAAQACADAGANVINMSLGGSTKNKTEERKFNALNGQGILSIAAAGNSGNNRHSYPASYSSVVSVAALDITETVASFSQYTNQVELAAPGVAVLSTTPWKTTATAAIAGGETLSGTVLENSTSGSASGELVSGGLCDTSGSPGSYAGKVVLCQRGGVTFLAKVQHAQDGDAVAVLIYNNEPGDLHGTLGDGTSTIPALGFSDEQGTVLLAALGSTVSVVSHTEFPGSGYEAWDGTSMATPHVAGVAALLWTHNAAWTNGDIRNALTSTAKDLGAAGRDNYYGYGLIQAEAALISLLGGSDPGPDPDPVNQAPVASFTFSCEGLTCSFDGSASSDPDGSIASHSWSFGASGPTASHTFPAGSHIVTLTVTDDQGATSSTSKTVTVSDGSSSSLVIVEGSVTSQKTSNGGDFTISWLTNLPSNSVVTFTGHGSFTNTSMVTSHTMAFKGSKNAQYEYTVSSTDANGVTATAGPFIHQN